MMTRADDNQPIAGSSQINRTSEPPRKEKRRRKPNKRDQTSETGSDALPATMEPLSEAQAPVDFSEAQAPADPPVAPAEDHSVPAPTGELPSVPAEEPAPSTPVSVQAITDAYGDYTRKSLEQTSSLFEHLLGTRSFGRALELQTEFARTAFETFVDESRKIRELHRELARQRLQSLEGFMMGRTQK